MMQEDLVTALSSIAGGRVYPQLAAEGCSLPYVIYSGVGAPMNDLAGTGTLYRTVMALNIYAITYAEAQSVAASVKGIMTSFIHKNLLQMQQDLYEQETRLHRVLLEFVVWHN